MMSVEEFVREHNRIAVLALMVMGFALLWGSTYLEETSVVFILTINLGAALIVSAIAIFILSYAGREVEKIVEKEVGTIHKEIKSVGDELRNKSDALKDELINKFDILAEAKKCGVVHIFESRRRDPNYKKELIKQLENVEKQKDVLIMSNSLRDFFGPRPDREYISAIFKMLRNEVKIRILLLDPTSDAAKARAMVEEKERVIRDGYIASSLFTDIKAVAKWLDDPSPDLGKDIRERIINQIHVRFFPYDPTTHIIKTDKFTFIEQYHRGGEETIRKELEEKEGIPLIDCFGGFVPVLMIDNSAFFARLMESHFNNIWKAKEVEERDLRKKNYFQEILRFERDEKKKHANSR